MSFLRSGVIIRNKTKKTPQNNKCTSLALLYVFCVAKPSSPPYSSHPTLHLTPPVLLTYLLYVTHPPPSLYLTRSLYLTSCFILHICNAPYITSQPYYPPLTIPYILLLLSTIFPPPHLAPEHTHMANSL